MTSFVPAGFSATLTPEQCKSILDYDSNTGDFIWKVRTGSRSSGVGNKAGTLNKRSGYVHITILGKKYYAHRLVWLYTQGKFPDKQVDHIDGNKSNNRLSNLREATNQENTRNGKRRTTRLKGATQADDGKWNAAITVSGKGIYLGRYFTEEEAHQAYCLAAKKYFGDFWREQ